MWGGGGGGVVGQQEENEAFRERSMPHCAYLFSILGMLSFLCFLVHI